MVEKSWLVILVLVSIMFVIPIWTSHSMVYASTSVTGIVIPLYSYPDATWDDVATVKLAHQSVPIIAIINPDSGPGSYQDTTFVTGIQKLRSAGVTVLGYVYTSYGLRSTNDVMADIDSYKKWYPVDGIKFDEMANTAGFESYYSDLSNYAKSQGFTLTFGNPGTDTLSSYIGTVDNITIFEDSSLPSISFLGGWHSNYDKTNFSAISYGIKNLDQTFVTTESQYVGYTYLTDDTLPDPYDTVSSYLDSLATALDTSSGTPPSLVPLTINAAKLNGKPISVGATIQTGNTIVQTGSTPITYYATSGTTYTITVPSNHNHLFDHWENGSTNLSRTITPIQATTLVAYYKR